MSNSDDAKLNSKNLAENRYFRNGQYDNQDLLTQYSFIRNIRREHKRKFENYSRYSHVAEIAAGTKKGARRLKKLSEPKGIKWAKKNAKQLLKALRSDDVDRAKKAAIRISNSGHFQEMAISEIIAADIRHTNCLDVIAIEKGFKNFADLRLSLINKKKMNGNV